MGLIWMVLQSIGSATILSSLESGIKDFVLIGNLTLLPQCREVFPAMEKLYGVRFRIPKYSEFCTAIGAALDYKRQANNHPESPQCPIHGRCGDFHFPPATAHRQQGKNAHKRTKCATR